MLTPAELAAHCRCSERTIARLVDDGCPSIMVGRRRRFDLPTVMTWMQQRGSTCQYDKTPKAVGMPRLAFSGDAFTAACRLVQVRATPSESKPT